MKRNRIIAILIILGLSCYSPIYNDTDMVVNVDSVKVELGDER